MNLQYLTRSMIKSYNLLSNVSILWSVITPPPPGNVYESNKLYFDLLDFVYFSHRSPFLEYIIEIFVQGTTL